MNPLENSMTWEGFLSLVTKEIVDHGDLDFDKTVAYHLGITKDYEVTYKSIQVSLVFKYVHRDIKC